MPLPAGMSTADTQALTAARGKVYGSDPNSSSLPNDATDAERALVWKYQYASKEERDAAKSGKPLPASAKPPVPARAEEEKPASPGSDKITLKNDALSKIYGPSFDKMEAVEKELLARQLRDKDKPKGQREASPEEYERLLKTHRMMQENINKAFREYDEKYGSLSAEDKAKALATLQNRMQRTDALMQTYFDQFKDPFDADKFFSKIEPKLREVSEDTGKLVRTTLDTLVKGVETGIDAITDAAKDPKGTWNGIWGKTKDFFSDLDAGKIGGGLIGGLAAFLVGGMLPGPMKWIVTPLLLVGFMLLGATKLSGPINHMFSGFVKGPAKGGDSPAQQPGIDTPDLAIGQQPVVGQGQSLGQAPAANGQSAAWTTPFELPPGAAPFRPMNREDLRDAVPSSVARSTRYAPEGSAQDVYDGGRAASPRAPRRDESRRDHDDIRIDAYSNGNVGLRSDRADLYTRNGEVRGWRFR